MVQRWNRVPGDQRSPLRWGTQVRLHLIRHGLRRATSLVRGRQGLRHGRHTGRPYDRVRTAFFTVGAINPPIQSQTHCATGDTQVAPTTAYALRASSWGACFLGEGAFGTADGKFYLQLLRWVCYDRKKCTNRCGRSCQLCFSVR